MLMNHQLYRSVNLIIFLFYFVQSDFKIDYIPYIVSFFWGIVIIGWDFFTKRIMFKQPYWYLLLGVCISYGISIITNFPTNIFNNGMNLVYLAISLFIFYVVDPEISAEKRNRHYQKMNDAFIYATFFLALVSFLMFVFNISYHLPDGARQGFMENRLFGVYTSPNMGSMFGYVSVFLMLVNNYFKRGSWKKFQKSYLVNGIIQYLCFILAQSRGTQLAIIGLTVFVFLIYALKSIVSRKPFLSASGKNAFMLIGLFVTLVFLNGTVETGLSYVPSLFSNAFSLDAGEAESGEENVDNGTDEKPIEQVVIQHSDENAEFSSGRFTIWSAGLQLVRQRPLFGVGDSYVYRSGEISPQIDETKLSEVDKYELRRAHGNMHNTYVAVLVKGGIVTFAILAVFVVLILKDNVLFLMDTKLSFSNEDIQMYVLTLAFLLSLFVNDLVENHLIFNNRDVMGLVFWSYLGFLNHFRLNMETAEQPER